jgi:hypothetical protein
MEYARAPWEDDPDSDHAPHHRMDEPAEPDPDRSRIAGSAESDGALTAAPAIELGQAPEPPGAAEATAHRPRGLHVGAGDDRRESGGFAWPARAGAPRGRSSGGAALDLDSARAAYDGEATAATASQLCRSLREHSADPWAALDEALPMFERFHSDRWVASWFGWIAYDAVKRSLDEGDLPGAAEAIYRLVGALRALGPSAGLLAAQAARVFARASRAAKDDARRGEAVVGDLLLLGETVRDHHLAELPTERAAGDDGRPRPSVRDQLLHGLRRCYTLGRCWSRLAALCLDALTGRVAVDDPLWFGRAGLEAAAHLDPVPPLDHVLARFLAEHGANEHVQVTLARYLDRAGDSAGAERALVRAAALAGSPWSWQECAARERERGEVALSARALEAGLSYARFDECDKTWRLHFELARAYADLGEGREAAEECGIAAACRTKGGWPVSREIEAFVSENEAWLPIAVPALDADALRRALGERQHRYREARGVYLRARAERRSVRSVSPDGRRAFLAPAPGSPGPDALLTVRSGNSTPVQGTTVLAIAIPSWDKKRDRVGARVLWWEPILPRPRATGDGRDAPIREGASAPLPAGGDNALPAPAE